MQPKGLGSVTHTTNQERLPRPVSTGLMEAPALTALTPGIIISTLAVSTEVFKMRKQVYLL